MTDPRFERLMNLVEAASDLPPDEAERYLAEACDDDAKLLAEARSLVAVSQEDGGLTQALADELALAAGQIAADSLPAGFPAKIGRYRILDKLGEGGMGAVYLAEQQSPIRREVALKVVRAGLADQETLSRFDAERQALARLEHPGIARVYDAGTTKDGVPFFAMELVRGEPITSYCDEQRLSLPQRLNVFGQVCRAIQHAHYNGIIHRDIKPSNVLVTEVDGTPQAKVIDFGIAKIVNDLASRTGQTRIGTLMGTLEYMSPEQAEGSEHVDTRSDVYSLGVLLYELTSGCLPFNSDSFYGKSVAEVRDLLLATDPPPPSAQFEQHPEGDKLAEQRSSNRQTLLRDLKGDLDWVTQKSLEREPSDRYATPLEIVGETERFLNHEPVLAAAPTLFTRAIKFHRRHRLATTAATLLFLAVSTGATLSTIGFLRAAEAQKKAEHEAMVATETSQFLTRALAVVEPNELNGGETTVREILDLAQTRLEAAIETPPEVEARIRYVLGASYASLGEYASAIANLLRAGELREQSSGATTEQAAQALTTLSDVLAQRGQFVLAQMLNEELGRLYAAEYGVESSQYGLARVRTGTLFQQAGAGYQAQAMLGEATAILNGLPKHDPILAEAIETLRSALEASRESPASP